MSDQQRRATDRVAKPTKTQIVRDKLRMAQWLLLAAFFYALALTVFSEQHQLQTLCWKLGNLTVAAYFGYWIDRRIFWHNRLCVEAPPLLQIRRAIIVSAAMLSVGLGL